MTFAEAVARASAAWSWWPEDALVLESDEGLLVRLPDYFAEPPTLLRAGPGAVGPGALERSGEQSRAWGFDTMLVWVRLGAPSGLEPWLQERGAVLEETVDVLALDLTGPPPALDEPDLDVRRRTGENSRDFVATSLAAFEEGAMPDEPTLRRLGEEAARDARDGRGCQVIVYDEGAAIGSAGLTMDGTAARLWGAGVIPRARGRGAYRALLAARLRYAAEHGATLALVKGRVQTSGPVLRRAGFTAHGQERSYRLPV